MNSIDATYLQQLIDVQGSALKLYARQWCRAPEDAVQEALIELVKQTMLPNDPVAWLYTTVRRRAINLERADSRRRKHQTEAGQEQESWFIPAENDYDDAADCERMLTQLPEQDREIVVARIWGDLSFAQIAELVSLPLSTVYRRYQQALLTLKQSIDQTQNPEVNDGSKQPQS
ncbi:RNA polymerase sigma factor [Novipirellula sp. SH528]|uniref:RNA polymerase sigma factor n=1 Tax=Novipirellula sp. SH528 TaxID=3454466 RepID=UPI003F9EEF24